MIPTDLATATLAPDELLVITRFAVAIATIATLGVVGTDVITARFATNGAVATIVLAVNLVRIVNVDQSATLRTSHLILNFDRHDVLLVA
jgi:hypothetical protein